MATKRPTLTDENTDTVATATVNDSPPDAPTKPDLTTEYSEQTLADEVEFPNKKERGEAVEKTFWGEWSKDVAEEKGLKALLYGPPGSGKTWLAATFPSPLILDLEGGLRTTFQMDVKIMRYPKNPNREITKLDQVRKFYDLVANDPNPRYETIVIDSLNELQILCQKDVLGTYDVNRVYDDQLTLQDYGKVNRMMLDLIRNFIDLPFHIVMTAVETPVEWEGQRTYPKFTGKQVWPELQRMVEQVGYCQVRKSDGGKQKYMVSFALSESYIAKDRLGIKDPFIANNFDAILAAVPDDVKVIR